MSSTQYMEDVLKYTINERLETLPASEVRDKANELREILGLSVPQFNRIRYRKAGDPGELKESQLMAIAEFFKVSIEEIISL